MTSRWPHGFDWRRWVGWKWPGTSASASPLQSPTTSIALVGPGIEVSERPRPVETATTSMLSEMEAAACAVFADHGLPDRPGEYALSPRSTTWRYLSESLTAEERWALVLAQKEGSGWRFGTLAVLGDQPDSPAAVRRAAQVLKSCAQLRASLAQGGSADLDETLQAAIGLGAVWRQLDAGPELLAARHEPLKLTMPTKPRAKRTTRKASETPSPKAKS